MNEKAIQVIDKLIKGTIASDVLVKGQSCLTAVNRNLVYRSGSELIMQRDAADFTGAYKSIKAGIIVSVASKTKYGELCFNAHGFNGKVFLTPTTLDGVNIHREYRQIDARINPQ